MNKKVVLIIDNVRSLYNVGAMFRVATGLGVEKIYLTGISPIPPRKEIHKTALGAENRIAWQYAEDIVELINNLKLNHYLIIALEQTSKSKPLGSLKTQENVALIVGHETDGVSKLALDQADLHLEIPMYHQTSSLNVATATAIALWHILSD